MIMAKKKATKFTALYARKLADAEQLRTLRLHAESGLYQVQLYLTEDLKEVLLDSGYVVCSLNDPNQKNCYNVSWGHK